MPHLYLPTDHTDADLVLAADVAAAVSSADLYVTWTLDAGAGVPEVEAVVREERPEVPVNPFAGLAVALLAGLVALPLALGANPYLLNALIVTGILTIGAMSLNLLLGFTGQLSLGHIAFFGIGAVVAARLVSRDKRGRAISMMFIGLTVANIVGVPVGTLAIGKAGAINAALLATQILCGKHPRFLPVIEQFRSEQTEKVLAHPVPGNRSWSSR